MLSHLLLGLLAGVSAQQCTCDSSPGAGWWTTGTAQCNACAVGGQNPLILTAVAPCTLTDSCRDINRPLAQRACYGIGTCQNNPLAPCNCTNLNGWPVTGQFCEKCQTGFTGWPQCITPVCTAATCSAHGSCDDSAQSVSCGVTGGGLCASTTYDLTPGYCTYLNYIPGGPNAQVCTGLGTGAAMVSFAAQGQVCGAAFCGFGYKCGNPAQSSAGNPQCYQEDLTPCPSRDTSQRQTFCSKGQTCCDGVCCNSDHTCADITFRSAGGVGGVPWTVTEAMVNTVWSNGNSAVIPQNGPGYSWAWGGGPWTNWKMQDGTTSTPWRMCSLQYLGAVSTTRVIILPMCLVFAVLVSLILVWRVSGLNPIMVAIPAIALVFCSIFLFFSMFWTVAVVISLAALFAMAAGHKGGNAFLAAILVEFFALAVVCGGLGLGSFWYANNLGGNLFFSLQNAHYGNWNALAACSNYYDYFVYSDNAPYNNDPTQLYTNYCSNGWYTYIGLVADLVVTFHIIMLVATGVAYLRGGGGGSAPPKTA